MVDVLGEAGVGLEQTLQVRTRCKPLTNEGGDESGEDEVHVIVRVSRRVKRQLRLGVRLRQSPHPTRARSVRPSPTIDQADGAVPVQPDGLDAPVEAGQELEVVDGHPDYPLHRRILILLL